jgi:predicted MFS family arabinose efflux permease
LDHTIMKTAAGWSHNHRGHIVVAASFVTMVLLYGLWYSYSVFLVALLKDFGWSRSVTAGAFSVFALVHAFVGPFFGPIAERLNPRRVILGGAVILALGLALAAETTQPWHLYVSFGVIAAMGIGFSGYVPLVILIRGWFPSRIGTAVGIATAGISVGITLLVPACQLLIEHLGWRWALRFLGLAAIAWLAPAAVWLLREAPAPRVVRPPAGPAPQAEGYWTLRAALRSWRFWGLCLMLFTANTAQTLFMIHQVAYLVDHGATPMLAATVAGLVGLTSIAGKPGWGFLMDRMRREIVFSLASGALVLGIGGLVLAGKYPATAVPYVYAVVLGLAYAITAPLTPAVANDLFGGPGFSTIFGTIHISLGLGTAAGAWAGGKVFDLTGSYAAALWGAVALACVSCAVMWLVAPRRPNPVRTKT